FVDAAEVQVPQRSGQRSVLVIDEEGQAAGIAEQAIEIIKALDHGVRRELEVRELHATLFNLTPVGRVILARLFDVQHRAIAVVLEPVVALRDRRESRGNLVPGQGKMSDADRERRGARGFLGVIRLERLRRLASGALWQPGGGWRDGLRFRRLQPDAIVRRRTPFRLLDLGRRWLVTARLRSRRERRWVLEARLRSQGR